MGLQLLVNPINFKNAKALINLGVDQLFVGLKNFSIHCECHLSLNEIKKLVKIKNVTKIFININRYFFENEINALTKILLQIAQINIDGIIFSDFAIPQILHEHKIKKRLTYNPETLVNNYGQFDFYWKNNIKEVALSRELNKSEIEDICKNKKLMCVQMQICGYPFVMHSRWQMLSSFTNSNKLKKRKLFIKEHNRKYPMIIYEDKKDTYVYGAYELDLIPHTSELSKMGIDVIRIDSFLQSEEWVMNKVKLCLKHLKGSNPHQSHSKFANGFYQNTKTNFIYLKEGENE